MAAFCFYLVGTVASLISRLNSLGWRNRAIEHYGRFGARLLLTPLLSGLAAVGGVLIVGLLTGATAHLQSTGGTTGPLSLTDIFSLAKNELGLLIAGVFGVTSSLLVE